VVLHCLAEYFKWIETKISKVEDLDYLIKEVEPRVKQSLAHLVNGGFFSHGDTYTILATLLDYVDTITVSYESLRQRYAWASELGPIFKGVVNKYEKVVKERHEIVPATPFNAPVHDNTTPDSSECEINAILSGDAADFPTSSNSQLMAGIKRKRANSREEL
jgi:hypothetical protein